MAKEPAKTIAFWHYELNCKCPECDKNVNLLDEPDFWDGRSLDACEHGTERTNNLEVACPECGYCFEVCCQY